MFTVYKCKRCDYDWASRLPETPLRCARCKRLNWQVPALRRRSDRPMVNGRIYPIGDLGIGTSVLIPWHYALNGEPDTKLNSSIHRAVQQEEKRYEKKFQRDPKPSGLLVTRLA